jgi:hypothetical protein
VSKLPKKYSKITRTYIGSHSKQIRITTKNKRGLIYAMKRKSPIISKYLQGSLQILTNKEPKNLHLKNKTKTTNEKTTKQRLGEGRWEPPNKKHQSIREPPSDGGVEGRRVARGHHTPGRTQARERHAPMRRRR